MHWVTYIWGSKLHNYYKSFSENAYGVKSCLKHLEAHHDNTSGLGTALKGLCAPLLGLLVPTKLQQWMLPFTLCIQCRVSLRYNKRWKYLNCIIPEKSSLSEAGMQGTTAYSQELCMSLHCGLNPSQGIYILVKKKKKKRHFLSLWHFPTKTGFLQGPVRNLIWTALYSGITWQKSRQFALIYLLLFLCNYVKLSENLLLGVSIVFILHFANSSYSLESC